MQTLAMPSSSQFLTVPKIIPHRKRSRSRSRDPKPREVVATPAASVSPSRFSPQSPPVPSAQRHVKPTLYTNGHKMAEAVQHSSSHEHSNGISYSNGDETEEQTGTNYDELREDMYTLEQCRTPPPEPPLRQKLIGTWKLDSYIAYATPESPVQRQTYPMTKNVTGFIMYTPDGFMSAQMLIPGQQSFKRGEGEEPQWAEAGKRFFAYCGPYYISNEGQGREEVLRHTFQVCNLPGWIGDIQIRTHRFEEDGQLLVLGSEEPTEIKVRPKT